MLTRNLKKTCTQTIVYWPRGAEDDHGQFAYGSPVEVKVRWEDVNEQFLDRNNNVRMSKAKVYTFLPQPQPGGPDFPGPFLELGVVWRGTTGTADSDPLVNPGAFEVRRVDSDPDEKGKEFLYTLYL